MGHSVFLIALKQGHIGLFSITFPIDAQKNLAVTEVIATVPVVGGLKRMAYAIGQMGAGGRCYQLIAITNDRDQSLKSMVLFLSLFSVSHQPDDFILMRLHEIAGKAYLTRCGLIFNSTARWTYEGLY